MVRWIGMNEVRGLWIMSRHDVTLPASIKENSFIVKKAWVRNTEPLSEAGIRQLTERWQKRVDAIPDGDTRRSGDRQALADWKKLIGWDEQEVEVDGGQGKPKQKQKVVTVTRKEYHTSYLVFRRWGKHFEVEMLFPFDSVKWDTGKGRGGKVLLQGYFDPLPISRPVRKPSKGEWRAATVDRFRREYRREPTSNELKNLKRTNYDRIPKGETIRLYFLPLHAPKYVEEVGYAAAAHAINQAGLIGREEFAEAMARLPAAEAALSATNRVLEDTRRQLARTEADHGRLISSLQEAERLLREKGIPFVTPSLGPGQAGLTGSPGFSTGAETTRTRASHNYGRYVPLIIGVLLASVGLVISGYGFSLPIEKVGWQEGYGAAVGGLFMAGFGIVLAIWKRPRKPEAPTQGQAVA